MTEYRLADLKDSVSLTQRMQKGGLNAPAAADKARNFARCAEALGESGARGATKVRLLFVPGRIEVLGKHTDYAGGRSVLATSDKGFCVVIHPRPDSQINLYADGFEPARFEMDGGLAPVAGHWSNYPMTVARRVARNFPGKLRGCDIAFRSDLPPAAGMSSSSAFIVASFLAYSTVNGLNERPEYARNLRTVEDLAGYLGACENGQAFGTLAGDKGVGTFGGSEDHTAILTCKPHTMNVYSYSPVRFERNVPMPAGYTFVIGASGIVAEKTGAALEKYNRASLLSRAVVECWNKATGRKDPHMAAAIASSKKASDEMRKVLSASRHDVFTPAELVRRCHHFFVESEEIIPAACDALAKGKLAEFGKQVDRSQWGTDALLGNQIPQTVCLAAAARESGAVAASAFGAGFGGAVWAMVACDKADEFVKAWSAQYAQAYPSWAPKAQYFATDAGPCAFEL